ncbi:MAG: CoA-binding protein, partial [Deltaproteobacteria bacterium]|nr:CoA-binding protein [Deltaproteobacteria bacterium]
MTPAHHRQENSEESFEPLLEPKSIAIFGASNQEGKVGYVCLKNLQAAYRGTIYPIHPHEKNILGLPAYPDLSRVPGSVDLAFVMVPVEAALAVIEQCGRKGVKAAIMIT